MGEWTICKSASGASKFLSLRVDDRAEGQGLRLVELWFFVQGTLNREAKPVKSDCCCGAAKVG